MSYVRSIRAWREDDDLAVGPARERRKEKSTKRRFIGCCCVRSYVRRVPSFVLLTFVLPVAPLVSFFLFFLLLINFSFSVLDLGN
jgi:hypothetical protein